MSFVQQYLSNRSRERFSMKYCFKCGAEMCDDALFCPVCGIQVPEEKKSTHKSTPVKDTYGYFRILFFPLFCLLPTFGCMLSIATGVFFESGTTPRLSSCLSAALICILECFSSFKKAIKTCKAEEYQKTVLCLIFVALLAFSAIFFILLALN